MEKTAYFQPGSLVRFLCKRNDRNDGKIYLLDTLKAEMIGVVPYFLLWYGGNQFLGHYRKDEFEILPPLRQIPLEDWVALFPELEPGLQREVKKYFQELIDARTLS